MTRHKKPVDGWTNSLAGELVRQPESGVRLVLSVSAAKSGEVAMLSRLLMLGTMRAGAGVGHPAKMRQILGKVGGMGAAATSPDGHADGKLWAEYET